MSSWMTLCEKKYSMTSLEQHCIGSLNEWRWPMALLRPRLSNSKTLDAGTDVSPLNILNHHWPWFKKYRGTERLGIPRYWCCSSRNQSKHVASNKFVSPLWLRNECPTRHPFWPLLVAGHADQWVQLSGSSMKFPISDIVVWLVIVWNALFLSSWQTDRQKDGPRHCSNAPRAEQYGNLQRGTSWFIRNPRLLHRYIK